MNRKALTTQLAVFTVLQLAMVVAGHWIPLVKDSLFAPLGTFLSLFGGFVFAMQARPGAAAGAVGGLIVGGLAGLIGIVVSYLLKDVPLSTLWIGGGASAVAGLIGGGLGGLVFKPR
ncbi:MAG: hypothetical protein K1X35_10035 [Caulobacteraceae bacterium]|nr:hypothetical protein [Caulobacteraceae bacterium]